MNKYVPAGLAGMYWPCSSTKPVEGPGEISPPIRVQGDGISENEHHHTPGLLEVPA